MLPCSVSDSSESMSGSDARVGDCGSGGLVSVGILLLVAAILGLGEKRSVCINQGGNGPGSEGAETVLVLTMAPCCHRTGSMVVSVFAVCIYPLVEGSLFSRSSPSSSSVKDINSGKSSSSSISSPSSSSSSSPSSLSSSSSSLSFSSCSEESSSQNILS